MKKTFTRALSGLLAVALVAAMPIAAAAEEGIATYSVAEVAPACSHTTSAKAKVVTPTCTTPGYTEYTCQVEGCGQKWKSDYVAMLGHNYEEGKTKDNGDVVYTCVTCKKSFTLPQEEVASLKHNHNTGDPTSTCTAEVHTATCKDYGYTVYTCNVPGCGYVQVGDFEAPLAHTYGEWEIVKDATVTEYGTARHVCTVCGNVETVRTQKLAPYAKAGRITKDLTPAYTTYNGKEIAMYLAKGVTFEFANEKYGSRYKVSAFTNVDGGSSEAGEYYVETGAVEVDPGTVPVYTGYTGLQEIATVTTDGRLNVRAGYSDSSAVISSVSKGETLYVYEKQGSWGRISATENKWVLLTAANVDTVPVFGCGAQKSLVDPDPEAKEVADVGTVTAKVSTIVRDSGNRSVGSLPKGTKINFYYSVDASGKKVSPFTEENGRIVKGYIDDEEAKRLGLSGAGTIDMTYVSLASGKKTGSDVPAADNNSVIATGIVTSSINLRVRSEPKVSVLNQIGSLSTGTKVELLEIGDYNGASWGRINYNGKTGWICMAYVQIQSSSSSEISTGAKENGVVANCSVAVNVRDAADISGRLVTTIKVGTRVAITRLENGWGLVDGKGWVYMNYIKLDAGAEDNIGKDNGSSKGDAPVTTYTNVTVLGKVKSGEEAILYTNAMEKTGTEILTMVGNREFTITDRTVINNTTWYKAAVGSYTGWVKSDTIDLPALNGTVKTNDLNVYSAASLDSEVVNSLVLNTKVTVEANSQITDGVYVWGKLKGYNGYVQMNNLTLTVEVKGGNEGISVGTTPITGKTNAATEVMEKPNGKVLLKLAAKQSVNIDTWLYTGGQTWAKVAVGEETGWILLSNVDQDAVKATVNSDLLELYEKAGDLSTKTALVKRQNDSITVLERKLVGTTAVWGRIAVKDSSGENDYWVNLAGTTLGTYSLTPGSNTNNGNNNSNNSNNNNNNTGNTGNTGTTTTTATGTIVNADEVNVRSGAGVANAKVTTLKRGTQVTVYEQKTVDDALWGRIDQGWIAMQYVDLSSKANNGSSSTVPSGSLSGNTILTTVPSGAIGVGFVNTANLAVRNGAGQGYTKTGTLALYTNVVIYEHVLKDGMIWGRCDQGWICTSYVTYTGTSVTGSGTAGTIARCFYTANVRSAPGVGNALVGKIMVNSRVEILEQQSYSGEMWGRTSLGWVSMGYVLTDGTIPTP